MECALLNLLEPGEKLLVVENGIWGARAADLGKRLNFQVKKVSVPLGQAITLDAFEKVFSFSFFVPLERVRNFLNSMLWNNSLSFSI